MKPFGVILAGGQSTRMGGENKALIELGGSPMIAHVIARLLFQTSDMVINSNADPDEFDFTGLPVTEDSTEGFAGPLAGILSGMDFAHAQGAEFILTAATDTPFFPLDLASKLQSAGKDIAIAKTKSDLDDKNLHPTFGLWRVSLRDDLRAALSGGTRKVMAWVDQHDWADVEWEAGVYDPFFNVNRPEDMERAEEILKGSNA